MKGTIVSVVAGERPAGRPRQQRQQRDPLLLASATGQGDACRLHAQAAEKPNAPASLLCSVACAVDHLALWLE